MDYFISGVWKNSQGNITHVGIHKLLNAKTNHYSNCIKKSERDVIQLIKNGVEINTAQWNYAEVKWDIKAKVGVVSSETSYLRTYPDKLKGDNLDNLIDMSWYNII